MMTLAPELLQHQRRLTVLQPAPSQPVLVNPLLRDAEAQALDIERQRDFHIRDQTERYCLPDIRLGGCVFAHDCLQSRNRSVTRGSRNSIAQVQLPKSNSARFKPLKFIRRDSILTFNLRDSIGETQFTGNQSPRFQSRTTSTIPTIQNNRPSRLRADN